MKAKPIFYQEGNDRKFNDQYTISLMTGEPMPRKWQEFFELTPEEKARWDASLKLDEEYRIAEAQGFPNGIPGGKTRGDMLHYLTQQEEAHKKSMQERSFLGQSFIPNKTEIQRYNNIMPNDTLAYGQGNLQPSFTFDQKLNTESLYARPNNLLQMNTDIKKEPAFDLKQSIRKLADRLREMGESGEEQTEMNLPTKLELYELLSPYGTTYKEIKNAYPQIAQSAEQFDESNMTYEDMINIGKQVEVELNQIIESKPDGQYITDYEIYEVLSKYGVKYKDLRKIRLYVEEKLKNMPLPRLNFIPEEMSDKIRDGSYDLSGVHGEGIFYYRGLNADETVIDRIWDEIREKLEYDEEKICSYLCSFLDEWGKKVLEIALYKLPMPLHIKGALGVILITFAVVEAAKNVAEKRKNAIDEVMRGKSCSEEIARLEVDKKVNGWVAEEIGKGIIAAALESFLARKGLSELTSSFITSAWATFISSGEFNAWKESMKEVPQ